MKRGLVVSVGGSKGAYAGGIVEYYLQNGKKYDNLYGSSIGSLVTPFAATGNYNKLKTAMLKVSTDDVFSVNPFKIQSNQNGIFKYTINYLNVFKNLFINKSNTLGDTSKLRTEIIPQFFPEKDYLEIINSDIVLKIMVTNISTGELEIKSIKECTYNQFTDWLWASTCAPPFMSLADIQGCHYTDGGILSQVPIKMAILDGCSEIDVIILDKENDNWAIEHIRNLFHYQIKVMLLMMNRIKDHQIDLDYLTYIAKKKVRVNMHFLERRLTNNSLLFDPELMAKWWKEGYAYAENMRCKSYLIDGRNGTYSEL